MASFRNVSIIAFFLLACGVFLSTHTQAIRTSEQDIDLASELSSGSGEEITEPATKLLNHLNVCLKKVGEDCGPLFFYRIFVDQKNEIPASCCKKLVNAGKECHDTITDSAVSRPEFNGNATLYQTRAADTWNTCSD